MRRVLLLLPLLILCRVYAADMSVSSVDFKADANLSLNQLANSFGCVGKNSSPQLSWHGLPKETKSLAVTSYDPDAPTGSGFWHWIAYDINVNTKSLSEGASNTNAMPAGSVEVSNDAGSVGYIGACPPKGNGRHRYQFTIYALDVDKLPVPPGTTPAIIRFTIYKHAISKATIIGYAETR